MATASEMIRVMADVTGVPEKTLVVLDRHLVAAKLRTSGARGRNAPAVTARDVAHLLTALLASPQLTDAPSSVQAYAATVPHRALTSEGGYAPVGIPELSALPAAHSFVDALEALIRAGQNGGLRAAASSHVKDAIDEAPPRLEITVLAPATVGRIRIAALTNGRTANITYAVDNPWNATDEPPPKALKRWAAQQTEPGGDFERSGRITEKTVMRLAQLLRSGEEKKR